MSLLRLSLVVVILAGAVALAFSNPTMSDYLQFVQHELDKAMSRMDQAASTREQQFIRQVFASQSKKILQDVVLPHTRRQNWGLASRYETTVMDTRVVVLGVAGRFIPIEGVEEATVKIGRLAF
ncbi:DUF4359 domain-containing protein [Nitrospira sp. NS4]|uniref:DUF4359 domain-containing protein n=1 Tax=Nitrospira sp. NS4 TaxID=3414498 RepID=UPI003C2B6EE7